MPSKDTYHEKHPKVNAWRTSASSAPAKQRVTVRAMSAQVQRLAKRLGKDPDEIAAAIPPDTLRRTKYPVIEIETDGKRSFKHDFGIEEGLISSNRR